MQGKRVVVTGGGSGIGAATCHTFAREGAQVVVLDVNEGAARSVSAHLDGAVAMAADIGDSMAVDRVFGAVVERFGPIDAVVHSAAIDDVEILDAIGAGVDRTQVIANITDDQWQRSIQVNLTGTFYVLRASLRAMIPRGAGSIVIISSVGGIVGGPNMAYTSAKGGVLALARSAAKEVWNAGVRVNCIAPTKIDSPMQHRAPQLVEVARYGRPEEVAAAALFLASDESSYITGETLIAAGPLLTI